MSLTKNNNDDNRVDAINSQNNNDDNNEKNPKQNHQNKDRKRQPEIQPKQQQPRSKQFLHHTVTVCVVPPPEYEEIWNVISTIRHDLKDPGYYRWPPHVNLLYPFVKLNHNLDDNHNDNDNNFDENTENSQTKNEKKNNNVDDFIDDGGDGSDYDSVYGIVKKLESVTQQMDPFRITLDQFGTFGGKRRGVLWLNPRSDYLTGSSNENNDLNDDDDASLSPLHQLHSCLEEAFPMCQSQKGFVPHMTVSHFESLDDATTAQSSLETSNSYDFIIPKTSTTATTTDGNTFNANNNNNYHGPLSFILDRIYLLERKGDAGQFDRVAEIGLGSRRTKIFDPPLPFPGMPTSEDEWVYEERMKLKKRRNGSGGGGGRGYGGRRYRRTPRIPDTPEVIAAKRAERKAKRERLIPMTEEETARGTNDTT